MCAAEGSDGAIVSKYGPVAAKCKGMVSSNMKRVQPRRGRSSQRWLLVVFAGTRNSAGLHQREKREILAAGYGQERIRGPCCRRVPMHFCTAPNDAIAAQSEARPMHLVFHTQPEDDDSSDDSD